MKREDLIQQIVENIGRCQRRAKFAELKKIGLSRAQIGVLFMLSSHKQLQTKQIADFLGVSKSAASQLIDPLVRKGLISRQTSPKDRRVAYLTLSDSGKSYIKKLHKSKSAGLRSKIAVLTDKELEQLSVLAKKMSTAAPAKS